MENIKYRVEFFDFGRWRSRIPPRDESEAREDYRCCIAQDGRPHRLVRIRESIDILQSTEKNM